MSFFENILSNITLQTVPSILLIDSSGSVGDSFEKNRTVFDKFDDVLTNIPNEMFRMIFWNSPGRNECFKLFKDGTFIVPHIVKKTSVHQTMQLTKQEVGNSTKPSNAFAKIPNDWISDVLPTHIYYITDGQIDSDNILPLKNEIIKLFKNHNNIHLHLITVENRNIDLNNNETLKTQAGGDVYKLFCDNGLTKHITEFTSITKNCPNGHKHIDVVIPPEGFIPYEQNYFAETNLGDFIDYINNIIKTNSQNEDYLIRIIQNLTSTIRYLNKNKLPTMSSKIIRTFCDLFNETVIDKTIVEFMLNETTKQENNSIVYSEYRKRVKEYFKQADEFLGKNVKVAIGLNKLFITLPIDNIVVVGNSSLVVESCMMGKKVFPESSIILTNDNNNNNGNNNNNVKIPVLPFETTYLSDMNEQCIRQYIRQMISTLLNIGVMDDYIIYVVMAMNLRVSLSNINERYKNGFKKFAIIMLKKKRLNTTITELEYFAQGNAPTPNDNKVESFNSMMTKLKTFLNNINCENHTLWYAMCLAINNDELCAKQLIHCQNAILIDFPKIPNIRNALLNYFQPLIKPISVLEKFQQYDYFCIYSGISTSTSGGYIISNHNNKAGILCCPQNVISEKAYNNLKISNNILCPECYSRVSLFEKVLPKNGLNDNSNLIITNDCFSKSITSTKDAFNSFSNIFNVNKPLNNDGLSNVFKVNKPFDNNNNSLNNIDNSNMGTGKTNVNYVSNNTLNNTTKNLNNNNKKCVVFMKGTIGAGKTTFSTLLHKKLLEAGQNCIIIGMDKYVIQGYQPNMAVNKISDDIENVKNLDNVTIIVDTCGESASLNNLFNHNLSGWSSHIVYPSYNKSMLKQYLAWSLNNVLNRQKRTSNSNYNINPIDAGEQICRDVHKKKAINVFGKKNVQSLNFQNNFTFVSEYQQFLNDNYDMEHEVNFLATKIVG